MHTIQTIEQRLAQRAKDRAKADAIAQVGVLQKNLRSNIILEVRTDCIVPLSERISRVTFEYYRLLEGVKKQLVEDLYTVYLEQERAQFLERVDSLEEIIGQRVAEMTQNG